jgi:hypothetical protein
VSRGDPSLTRVRMPPAQERSRHPVGDVERLGHLLVQRDVAWAGQPGGARRLEAPADRLRQHPRPEVVRRLAELLGVGLGDRSSDPVLVLADPFAELARSSGQRIMGGVAYQDVGSERRRGRRTLAMTALGRARVRGGINTGPFGSRLESRTTKRAVDVGFQVVPPGGIEPPHAV